MTQDADFLIKQKGQDGKNRIVGRGWKKKGPYGDFVSLSIGDANNRQNYLLVENDLKSNPVNAKLDEGQWKSLAEAAASGPKGPKESTLTDVIGDDDLGI